MRALPALLALCAACTGRDQPQLTLDATIVFPPRDTVRFSLSATTHRCSEGRTILVQGVSPEGNGVLVRLHFRDSLVSGAYRAVAPADTSAPSAVVAVRYLLRDTPHAFFFDTGAVQVRREGGTISGRAQGSASESGIRAPTLIQYRDVALPERTDTVPCRFEW